MKKYYTADDVIRWANVDQHSVELHLAKLAGELPPQKVDFHLSMLSGAYYMRGMTCIAGGSILEAINSFRASIETRCKMYDRFENGVGRPMEAGYFQSLLVAFVTCDEGLISKFANHYNAEDGTPNSVFLGRAVKCLALSDLDGAKNALRKKKPRFESQFVGYAECLEAIADKNESAFEIGITIASTSWAKWASRVVKGLPDSVCFIQGIGLIRLAEKTIGKAIHVRNEYLPDELLASN